MNSRIHNIKEKITQESIYIYMPGMYAVLIKQSSKLQRYILITPSNTDHYCGGIT